MNRETLSISVLAAISLTGCATAPNQQLPPSPPASTPATASSVKPESRVDPAVETKVKKIIADELSVQDKDVVPGARLREDLGADDLDLVELIMRLEEEFNIEIPDQDAEKLKTVGDTCSYIQQRKA